jgi:ketosteroid isomerase-like protein
MLTTSAIAGAQSSQEKEVSAAVEALRLAMVDPDQKTLDNLTSAKLSYGHSSGKVEDKASFIQALISKESDFTEITLSDQTITIVGDMAMVRHKLTGKTHDKGKEPGTVNLGVLLIWYKDKNVWQLTARQAYKL